MTSFVLPTRTEIERINASFSVAFRRGDVAGLEAVYTTDAQILPPNSEIWRGKLDIQTFWQAVLDRGVAVIHLDTLEFEEHGGTAWEVGKGVLQGKDGQVIDEVKYIVLWKRERGVWKWHRNMWNSSRPTP